MKRDGSSWGGLSLKHEGEKKWCGDDTIESIVLSPGDYAEKGLRAAMKLVKIGEENYADCLARVTRWCLRDAAAKEEIQDEIEKATELTFSAHAEPVAEGKSKIENIFV